MSRSKRALCAAMICAMALSGAHAEPADTTAPSLTAAATATAATSASPTAAPEPSATTAPTATATPSATVSPTASPEPSASAAPTATVVPSASASPSPSPSPSTSPEASATPVPSASPEASATPAPSASPEASPSPSASAEPSASPAPTPGPISEGGPVISVENVMEVDGVWQVSYSTLEDLIAFTWQPVEGAAQYILWLASAEGALTALEPTAQTRLEIAASTCAEGVWTLYAGAVLADGSIAWGSAAFQLTQGGGMPGGGFPGGFPGGSFDLSGILGSLGGMGEMNGEMEQGFTVVPGEALTDSHASGTEDASLYGSLPLELAAEAETALTLDGVELDVSLADGGAFTASLDGDVLTLTPESGGGEWRIGGLALITLRLSGVRELRLVVGGEAVALGTEAEFSGAAYGALRAAGYVSKDFVWQVTASATTVAVDGEEYEIGADGTLVPLGG